MRIDSRDLSKPMDSRHRTILENIDKYYENLQDLGGLIINFEQGAQLDRGGFAKRTRYAMINENQCLFLVSVMYRSHLAAEAKRQIVAIFFNQKTRPKSDLAIRDGIRAEMEYKEVYQLAKVRAGALVGVMGLLKT